MNKLDKQDSMEIDLDKITVECLCPKCGKKHKKSFPWTGRGIPRKYCFSCKSGNPYSERN